MDNPRNTPTAKGTADGVGNRKPYVAPEIRLLGRMSERTLAGAGTRVDTNFSRGKKVRGVG
jgi:hypothetical protein